MPNISKKQIVSILEKSRAVDFKALAGIIAKYGSSFASMADDEPMICANWMTYRIPRPHIGGDLEGLANIRNMIQNR